MASDNTYRDFNKGIIEKINKYTDLFININPKSYTQCVMKKSVGITGVWLGFHPGGSPPCVELIMQNKDKLVNKSIYNALCSEKSIINNEFGENLDWDPGDNQKRSAIRKRFYIGTLENRSTWPKLQDQMVDAMLKFIKIFIPRLKNIKGKL